MTGAPRLLTVATFLAAGAVALGACGVVAAPSDDAAVVVTTTTTTTRSADTAGDPSEGAAEQASGEGSADADADAGRLCADDPRADATTEVVVNRGEMDCAEVTALLDEYGQLARSGRFGNAGIVPDIDGFSCASPTARSAGIAGIHTRCSTADIEILVRPSEPHIPGEQQDVHRFIPESSLTHGRSFFTIPGGQGSCAIFPDHTPPKAACYGPMPAGLPQVPDLAGVPTEPNSVQVDQAGPARPVAVGTTPYPLDGVPFTTLEVGQTLASSGFACTVTARDTVTCTNAAGEGFDYSPAAVTVH